MRGISRYMNSVVQDYVDPLTGEVNSTSLAEDCYAHFHPEDNSGKDIPDVVFEVAERIATFYEIQTGVREGRIGSGLSGLINSLPPDHF